MSYVGQINYLLSMLVVTLILSDFVNLKYNFSFLKILNISEKERKKALKRVKTREGRQLHEGGGAKTRETISTNKRKEK